MKVQHVLYMYIEKKGIIMTSYSSAYQFNSIDVNDGNCVHVQYSGAVACTGD